MSPVRPTRSDLLYVASSSIDGNVCITSLVDPKDAQLRNFGRPLQAVALSPDFKTDRTYLSGGLAGKLILTVGGRSGTSSTATPATFVPESASSWLSSIGLASNTAKDVVLHAGEGPISTIKWSQSGKYVVWVNEQGFKIMRSHIGQNGDQSESAWKRIGHVDRPYGQAWEEMGGVWKSRVEWVNERSLESDELSLRENTQAKATRSNPVQYNQKGRSKGFERLLVGWGGTVWIIHVHHGYAGVGKNVGEKVVARAEIVSM